MNPKQDLNVHVKSALGSAGELNEKLAPHKPITQYYADESQRVGFLEKIFDQTGIDYDRIENVLSFGSGRSYRRKALIRAGLQQGMQVIDVGFGTGLLAKEAISIIGYPSLLVGVDPSEGMINASGMLGQVKVIQGRAEDIPLSDNYGDFLSIGYALRHFSDLRQMFSECYRVLKPGGRLCILEISKPRSVFYRTLLKLYMRSAIPIIAKIIAKSNRTSILWRYYWDSIEHCSSPEEIINIMQQAGFVDVNRKLSLGIFSEYQASVPQLKTH